MCARRRFARGAQRGGRRLVEAEGQHLRGGDGFDDAGFGEAGGGDVGFDVSDAPRGGDAGGQGKGEVSVAGGEVPDAGDDALPDAFLGRLERPEDDVGIAEGEERVRRFSG